MIFPRGQPVPQERTEAVELRTHSQCWRCGRDREDIVHLLWECALVPGNWKQIWNTFEKELDTSLELNARIALLHGFSTFPEQHFM